MTAAMLQAMSLMRRHCDIAAITLHSHYDAPVRHAAAFAKCATLRCSNYGVAETGTFGSATRNRVPARGEMELLPDWKLRHPTVARSCVEQ